MTPSQSVGEEGFGHGIDRAPGPLLAFKAAASTDISLHRDKGILGMTVRDEFMMRGKGPDPNPGALENAGFNRKDIYLESEDVREYSNYLVSISLKKN